VLSFVAIALEIPHDVDMPQSETTATQGVRARARAELVAEITRSARTQLAESGAAALSLRAVARDLGMASSAIYRYFPSRDALLTALIIESYNALGEACERAHDEADPTDLLGRWRSIAHAARSWATTNPHEYALIYGSPVPGYAAPDDTIDPATRIPVLLLRLLEDVAASGVAVPEIGTPVSTSLSAQVDSMREQIGGEIDDALLLTGVGAWTLLFGLLNFELFGQFVNTFDDAAEMFAFQVDAAADRLGLVAP